MKKLMKELPGCLLQKNNRKGSYLVEATLTLPVMILGAVALALIINMIAVCETIGFLTSWQMKEHLIFSNITLNTVSLCTSLEKAVQEECPQVTDFHIKAVRGSFQSGNVYDLMSITTETSFQISSGVGIGGQTVFEEKLMARAFTGARQDASPLEPAAFTQGGGALDVVIYPKYGERFHKLSCAIVQQQKEDGNMGWTMDVEEARRQGFTACQICGGGIQ